MDAPKAENWLCSFVATLAAQGAIKLAFFQVGHAFFILHVDFMRLNLVSFFFFSQQRAGGMFAEGWPLDEFGGFSTKFVLKVLAAAKSQGADAAALAEGLEIRERAGDAAALAALLTENGLELP